MKVVAILGGLGSQMFKYAFYLQICKNDSCYIDTTSYLLHDMWNGYELKRIFGIAAPDIQDDWSCADIESFKRKGINYKEAGVKAIQKREKSKYVLSFLRGYCYSNVSNCFLHAACLAFNKVKRILKKGDDVKDTYPLFYKTKRIPIFYDDFNHTSDTYIGNGNLKERLKEVFSFPVFTDEHNLMTMREMLNSESVAVHIRRSDHMYDNIQLFESGYFQKAVRNIKSRVSHPIFYVFSDEPEWCRLHGEQLGFEASDQIVIVDWNESRDSYRDMQLMTYCKHNILAISSFGWWGYYLSSREDKLVYAPKDYWLEVPIHY